MHVVTAHVARFHHGQIGVNIINRHGFEDDDLPSVVALEGLGPAARAERDDFGHAHAPGPVAFDHEHRVLHGDPVLRPRNGPAFRTLHIGHENAGDLGVTLGIMDIGDGVRDLTEPQRRRVSLEVDLRLGACVVGNEHLAVMTKGFVGHLDRLGRFGDVVFTCGERCDDGQKNECAFHGTILFVR